MEKQREFELHVTQQLKSFNALNKNICENQSRLLRLFKDLDERQNHLQRKLETLEKAVKGSTDNRTSLPEFYSTPGGTKQDDLSERISILEQRVHEVESQLKNVDETPLPKFWTSRLPKDDEKTSTDGLSIGERLERLESMSMGSWSSTSEQEGSDANQRLGKSLKRKGSFKAASLAIVFVNRLSVTNSASADTQGQMEETVCGYAGEKPGGDHMRAAGLAIIFMVRLLRALQLPVVLDDCMEITPD